ncbi:MAG: DUF2914 domain-containing protein, partial [Myxococcales bacterium]|nr:DUF2914 domain-containing protein [Myxococcales bacterium]
LADAPPPLDGAIEPVPSADAQPPAQPVAPAAEPAATEGDTDATEFGRADVSVRRVALTRAIVDREPLEPATEFEAKPKRLYAFVDLRNDGDGPGKVRVRFLGPDHAVTGDVLLDVPASVPRWRTWAWTQYATRPGPWEVVVERADGTRLDSATFTVTPVPAAAPVTAAPVTAAPGTAAPGTPALNETGSRNSVGSLPAGPPEAPIGAAEAGSGEDARADRFDHD